MAYKGPKWQPKPGVTYILPGIPYAGGDGGSSARDKEVARKVVDDLWADPERALANPQHPSHHIALGAFHKAMQVIHDEPLGVEKAEPDEKPFMPLLVRQIAEENPHHRRENAKQAVAEILDANKWKGADGRGKHPALDPASPQHQGWVEGLKQLLEWANTEPEGK